MSEPTPWDESVCNREIHAEIGGWPPTGGQNPTRQARHNAETGVTPLKAMFENQLMRVSSYAIALNSAESCKKCDHVCRVVSPPTGSIRTRIESTLLVIVHRIETKGAKLKSIADAWSDTTTPTGKLILTVLGGLAEFERSLIRERTSEGRERARKAGKRLRRPRVAFDNISAFINKSIDFILSYFKLIDIELIYK